MLRRRSDQMEWSEPFSMRPSIARMTLDVDMGDLGYDQMGMDEKAKLAHLAGRTDALQHRLTELLVFEIRQDGQSQFKTLSVRALYKYVIKAITVGTAEKRSGVKGNMGSRVAHVVSKHHHRNTPKSNGQDDNPSESHYDDSEDETQNNDKNNDDDNNQDNNDDNLHSSLLGSRNRKPSRDDEAKSVSFGGPEGPFVTEHPPKIPGVPIAKEEEHRNSNIDNNHENEEVQITSSTDAVADDDDITQEEVPEATKEVHENITYRERLGGYLHPRDMRRLVTPFTATNEPEVIVRRHVILLNFDPLRAVILRDRLLVIVPDGADSLLVDLEKRVRGGTKEMEQSIFGESAHPSPHESMGDIGDSQHSRQSGISTSEHTKSSIKGALKGSVSLLKKVNDAFVVNPIRTLHDRGGNILQSTFSGPGSDVDDGSTANLSQTDIDNNSGEFREWEEMEGRDWIDLPFELQSVDAVLGSVCAILGKDAGELRTNSMNAMDSILHKGTGHGEEILRHMKNSIEEMTSRVKGFTRAMNLVLDETEDMALMNLSRLLTHPDRFIQPVPEDILNEESDEPELILEAHLQTAFSLANSLDLIKGQIQTTQELINQRLDAVRNRLLLANMIISVGSFCVALGSFVGSLLGMNVTNHLENDPDAFERIVIGTVAGMLGLVLVFGFILYWAGTLPSVKSSF